jgi:predicted helicase
MAELRAREAAAARVGFELMMAPYTVAHLKLALELADRGFEFDEGDRINVYLTNTLERIAGKTGQLMAQWLTQEAEGAERVKEKVPVEVVVGNPPYSGHSTNKGKWIIQLLDEYKKGVPELKKPGQAKWLSDDYVKFIRFAHWRIARTGNGIVGFIANHSWLDNPTFRGMRASLKRDFDDIYILDLHGNSKKKERTPAAHAQHGDDKNVFDIQQGVAIVFLVRTPGTRARNARVRHAELWGSRDGKYRRLDEGEFARIGWSELDPVEPLIPFVPMDTQALGEYRRGWSVPAIFALNGDPAPGIVTTQDEFAISWTAEEAREKVETLLATNSEEDARKLFRLCSQDQWQYERAMRELADHAWRQRVVPILYRPLDSRWTVYDRNVTVHRRERVMQQLVHEGNIAFSTVRSVETGAFTHVFVMTGLTTHHTVSIKEVNYVFPLWLLPEHDTLDPARNVRHPNLDPRYLKALADALGVGVSPPFGLPDDVTPEDIFHFIYAVLHAPAYRDRYGEYLRSDFPRIPLPPDMATFGALAALGGQLVALHLLRDPALAQGGPAYPVSGDHVVDKLRYEPSKDANSGKVWINATQYFDGIDPRAFDFRIGGYQVLEKWLKDRKGRALTIDDITHYRKIAVAIARTRALMQEVDAAATPLFA